MTDKLKTELPEMRASITKVNCSGFEGFSEDCNFRTSIYSGITALATGLGVMPLYLSKIFMMTVSKTRTFSS